MKMKMIGTIKMIGMIGMKMKMIGLMKMTMKMKMIGTMKMKLNPNPNPKLNTQTLENVGEAKSLKYAVHPEKIAFTKNKRTKLIASNLLTMTKFALKLELYWPKLKVNIARKRDMKHLLSKDNPKMI